jgi:hypothetical protein
VQIISREICTTVAKLRTHYPAEGLNFGRLYMTPWKALQATNSRHIDQDRLTRCLGSLNTSADCLVESEKSGFDTLVEPIEARIRFAELAL